MIVFHRIMFAGMLTAAVVAGGLNEGRKDLLQQRFINMALSMSLKQLIDYKIQG